MHRLMVGAVVVLVLLAGCSTLLTTEPSAPSVGSTTNSTDPATTADAPGAPGAPGAERESPDSGKPTTTTSTATAATDADGWAAPSDPNPGVTDPIEYERTYSALVAIDPETAAAFNAVVIADGTHNETERAAYAVLPTLPPSLRDVVAARLAADGGVSRVALGTVHVLQYMVASEHHTVSADLRAALAAEPWRDSDGDRLVNPIEAVVGTNASTMHSDHDQWNDFDEVLVLETVGLADPHPTGDDVYVEVDSSAGVSFIDAEREALETEAFARSDRPVHWHFLANGTDTDLEAIDTWSAFAGEFDRGSWEDPPHKDVLGRGVHYVFITAAEDGIRRPNSDETPPGVGAPGLFIMSDPDLRDGYRGHEDALARTAVHEFGHAFGVGSDDHAAIDSREFSYEEYPSPMNYNSIRWSRAGARLAGSGALRYLDREPFDEIAEIRDRRFGANTPSGRDRLSTEVIDRKATLIWYDPAAALDREANSEDRLG